MKNIKNFIPGILICFFISIVAYFLGNYFPLIGAPVIAIISGLLLNNIISKKTVYHLGINYTAKKVLQIAIVFLGFGLNLGVILQTGKESLPIILFTISTSLIIGYLLQKILKIPSNTATLIAVGSSICGGSAIAATAPCIKAKDYEISQAISVIFFFNIIAALLFPKFGQLLNFPETSGHLFGLFAGTAINDTSSVTAAACTWDSMFHLEAATLNTAVTVKLTRTLAIIPICMFLSYKTQKTNQNFKKTTVTSLIPKFIIFFLCASILTTILNFFQLPTNIFIYAKFISKFLVAMAMAAIGLNTNIIQLIKNSGKPLLLGACCWIGIIAVSLLCIL